MKHLFKTGLCLLVIMLSVLVPLMVTVTAQSGHGGSTQVIARVESPSTESSQETQPEQESSESGSSEPKSSEPSEHKPAQTGDTALPLLLTAGGMICSAAIIAVIPKKRRFHS